MAELQDYLMTSTSLADYMPEELVGSVANEKSKTNLAANVATLSEDPVATFGIVKSELDTGPQSATHNSIMDKIKGQEIKANRDLFMNLFLDENTSDEDRVAMAGALAQESIPLGNEQDVISEQSLLQNDGVSTDEGFVTRDKAIGIFKEANRFRTETQKIQNAQKMFEDQNLAQMAGDIGELFVPFLEQGIVNSLRNDLEDSGIDTDTIPGGAFVLVGSTKAALAEAVQNMPVQQRMELLTKVTELVKANDSAVFDSNTLILADLLQTVLVDGSYSTSDEWIDNAIGVLDWIGIGSTVKSLGKLGKISKSGEAPKGADAANATDVFEDADDVVFPDEIEQPTTNGGATIDGEFSRVDVAEEVEGVIFPDEINVPATKKSRVVDIGEVDYQDITAKSVQTEVVRISPMENLNRNNTGKGRVIHETLLTDQTGQVAEALSGASRVEAAANNLLPQVRKTSGGVDYKLPTPNYTRDIEVRGPNPRTVVNGDSEAGRIYYYNSEKVKEQTLALNDFENAVGLTSRPNLTSFESRSDGVNIGVTYGPVNHGYANANDAVELTKYHLRDYGVKDSDITVLENGPKGYEPVAYSDNMPVGDYLVQVNYKHRFSAKRGQVTGKRSDTMVEAAPEESFINDIFEAFGPVGGAVRSSLFSAEATLDSRLMSGAFTAVDEAVGIEKQLVDLVRGFSKGFRGLKKSRKQVFTRAVHEANNLGISYTRGWAKGKWGFTDKEYDLLQDFKNVQDQLYWLENEDFVRSLKNKGYGEWTDGSATKLIARPLVRQQAPTGVKVLDPTTNQTFNISGDELTKLYQNNGVLAQLRTKFDFNGEMVEYIMSREQMGSGYFRTLTMDDAVLNYRPGYFKVDYKDPLFVIEELADGTHRTVATAPDTKAANLFVKRMQNSNPGRSFFHRPDLKQMDFDNSDAQFDVSVAQGRSSQRYRGMRLQDSTQLGQPMQAANIADPVEAFQHAATSISARISMRDYLEAYKQRLMNTYKEVMPTRDGQVMFPDNVSQIKDKKTGRNSKRVRQARAMYRYVDMLESTSGSNIGNITKAGLNSLADVVGNMEFRGSVPLERAARELSKKDPVAAATKAAFIAQIATNPLGQLITQGGGAIMSFGRNPKFFLRGGFMPQTWGMWAHRAGLKVSDGQLAQMKLSRAEWDEMMDALEKSGLPYAADANNLIRSGSESMSERDWAVLRGSTVGVLGKTQKVLSVGFDKGEFFNVTSAFLVFADESRQAGKLNNAEDWQRVAAEARNFTFGMNKAGQFGYQTNELRMPLQYFQIVQKMFQAVTTNKLLSGKDKAKLFGAMVVIFGTDGIPGLEHAVDKITEDWAKDPTLHESRDLLKNGILQYGINAALSMVSGEDQNLAIKERISPLDYNSAQTTVKELLTDFSFVELMTESPSGQVFGKGIQAMADGLKLINLSDEHLPNNPTDLATFAKSVATVFSGTTNLFKAKMAWEYGKSFSAGGFTTDQETTSVEAIAKMFGFRTMDEARQFTLAEDMYGSSQKEKAGWSSESDVEEWYKGAKRDIFLKQEDPSSLDAVKMIYGNVGHKLFANNPANLLILSKLMDRDANRGDHQFIDGIMRAIGVGIGETEVKSMINRLPNVTREQKADLLEMIDNVEALKRGE